jgi:O-antigen/teichoic acid export membrane protein
MSRSRRSIKTFVGGLAYTLATVTVGFLSVPFLLRWLGTESFGACRALTDWYGQFKLLELGLGASLLPMLAKGVGRTDARNVQQVMGAGIRAYLGTTVGFVIAGLVLAAVVLRLIPVGESCIGDLRTASLVGLLSFLITPLVPFRLLADARQEGFGVNAFLVLQSLATTALALLLAWAGWGIAGQIFAFVVGSFLFHALITAKVLVASPSVAGCLLRTRIQKETWRELWSLSPPTFFRQICTRVGLMSDAILVAFLLEPALVVPMIITQRLATLAQAQLQGIASASWAGLAELHALGRQDVLRRRLLELTTLVTVLSIAVLAPITAFNQDFVGRWVGSECFAGNLFTLVAASNAILLSLFTLWDSCFVGTGQVARVARLAGVSTGVNLGVSIVLTKQLGIVGPLLGSLTALLLINGWWMPYLLKRHFQISPKALSRAVLAPLAMGVPYWALVWWFAHAHPPRGWIDLAMAMAGSALLYLALAWVAIFNAGQRALWVQRVRMLSRVAA